MIIDKNYEDLNKLDKKQFRLEWSLRDYYLMPRWFEGRLAERNKRKSTKYLKRYLKFMSNRLKSDEAFEFVTYLNHHRNQMDERYYAKQYHHA